MDERRRDRRVPAVAEVQADLDSSDADEAAADAARQRYRTGPLPTLPPDGIIGPILAEGERVVAQRCGARLERRQPEHGAYGVPGEVYLTSSRLVFCGRVQVSLGLDDITDTVVSAGRLLLVLRDGSGVAIDVDRPRLLRVEISAARAARRRGTTPPTGPRPPQLPCR